MDDKTCSIVKHGYSYDAYEYEIVGHWWELSCGHTAITIDDEDEPKYCSECGRKVVRGGIDG